MSQNTHLGTIAPYETLHIIFSLRDDDGSYIEGTWGASPPATLYADIIDPSNGTIVTNGDDIVLDEMANFEAVYQGTAFGDTEGITEGQNYIVRIKDSTGGSPTAYTFAQFAVLSPFNMLVKQEFDDSTPAAVEDGLVGLTYQLERNQADVIFKRLKRALGLLGENQIVDGYVHDDAGNITQSRVRIFSTKASRDAVVSGSKVWEDSSQADPSPTPESGEIHRYSLFASHLLPRTLRTVFQAQISADAADQQYDSSSVNI